MFLFTAFMLVVIAWLFFNAMNEKRWVDSHRHDDSVAADTGFLPDFSAISRSLRVGDGSAGKLSIDQEDTPFARAVARVKQKTAKYSDGLEKRATAARVDDASRPSSAAEENDFFGRMVKRVSGVTRGMDEKIDKRMQAGRQAGEEAPRGGDMATGGSGFERLAARVGAGDEAIGDRMTQRFNERTAPDGESRPVAEEGGLFNRAVGSVSNKLESIEKLVDARLEKSHVDPADQNDPKNDDFIGRLSTRMTERVEDVKGRLVYADPAKGINPVHGDGSMPGGADRKDDGK